MKETLPRGRKKLGLGLAITLALGWMGCGGGGPGERENLGGGFGTITGIVDRSSTRAGGVVVEVEGTDLRAAPDEVGRFEFQRVPAGEYTVAAVQNGQNLGLAVSAQVAPDRITHVGLLQLRPGGQISGLVTASDTAPGEGKPVAGARVMARPVVEGEGNGEEWENGDAPLELPPPFRVALTQRDGRYRMMGVAPGHYVMEVIHPHWGAFQKEFDVEAERLGVLDFTLPPFNRRELGTVEGTVTDPQGQPLGRARVELSRLFPGSPPEPAESPPPALGASHWARFDPAFFPPRPRERVTYTDEQGRFTFLAVPPGRYRIGAVKRGYSVESQEIEVLAGQVTGEIKLVLESRLVEVGGRVFALQEDGTRTPLEEARILAREFSPLMRPEPASRSGPGSWQMGLTYGGLGSPEDQMRLGGRIVAFTDAEGRYTLHITPGPAVLRAEKEGYRPVRESVVVDPSSPPTVDFVLSPLPPEPPSGSVPGPRLSLELSLPAEEFPSGQPVEMTLRVTNPSAETVHAYTAYPGGYDFAVYGRGGELWRWSHDKGFVAVIGELTLEPGQSLEYKETWDQKTNAGRPVPPGEYVAVGFLFTHPRKHSERVRFRVVPSPAD